MTIDMKELNEAIDYAKLASAFLVANNAPDVAFEAVENLILIAKAYAETKPPIICTQSLSPEDLDELANSKPGSVVAVENIEQQWRTMDTAPRDGTTLLLYHNAHGEVTGTFSKGEWTEHFEYGREYSGSVWILGDDLLQTEVEEFPEGFHDGPITHWRHLHSPPKKEQ